MLSNRNKLILTKIFSLFSVIRGYNILFICIAQYLSAIYILSPIHDVKSVVLDSHLFVLILASSTAIAAGYIINNFYDSEKDLINRPQKSYLDRLISQRTKLYVYFTLNIITVCMASYVSFRSSLFFAAYIFLLWFYSHKLKKHPFIGNTTASILAVIPFFAVTIYYRNFQPIIFLHGLFLMSMLSMKEIVKDLENLKGDFAYRYKTIPVKYGATFSKKIITVSSIFTLIMTLLVLKYDSLGNMKYYFYFVITGLCGIVIKLWLSTSKKDYIILHNIIKLILLLGVLSIVLIKPELLLK